MTHKRKDCLERPRKVLAKYSNSQIAPDEYIQPVLNHSYDGKRDHWAGYDPAHHLKTTVERYKQIEEAKQQLRAEKLNNSLENKEVLLSFLLLNYQSYFFIYCNTQLH